MQFLGFIFIHFYNLKIKKHLKHNQWGSFKAIKAKIGILNFHLTPLSLATVPPSTLKGKEVALHFEPKSKMIVTLITRKSFINSMSSLNVHLQTITGGKWLGTLVTRKTFQTSMCFIVHIELTDLYKWLGTLNTSKKFFKECALMCTFRMPPLANNQDIDHK